VVRGRRMIFRIAATLLRESERKEDHNLCKIKEALRKS
jgi:hypothetical protein